METGRLLVAQPVETTCLVFNLADFTLANMVRLHAELSLVGATGVVSLGILMLTPISFSVFIGFRFC